MASTPTTKSQEPFYVLCGLVLITACLYWARQVLIPVALAVLLSFILTPCVSALQRRGLGRLLSVFTVVTLALLLLGSIGYLLSRQLDTLVANLGDYQEKIVTKIKALQGAGEGGTLGRIQNLFTNISKQFTENSVQTERNILVSEPGRSPDNPMYVRLAPSGWTRVMEAAGPTAEALASAFLVVVLVVFMLCQRESLRNRLVRLLGHGRLIVTTQAFDEGAHRISRYLIMQVFVNTVFGVILALGLIVAGLWSGERVLWQYAILWGFIAGSLRFVPYLGTWIAAALIAGFYVATLPGWGLPIGIFLFFLVVELITANVIEPLVFGHSTGISPLALLLAAAFWTWLWGPVGLILSTPLTVILVVLGKYAPQLQFLEVLLGDEPPLSTDVTFYQRLVARDIDEAAELIEDYLRDHPPTAACENVLLPALLMAKRDQDHGELDREVYQFVLQGMRDIREDITSAQKAVQQESKLAEPGAIALGCPGRDEADELTLEMLALELGGSGYSLEIISAQKLSAEVLKRIESESPAVVCIGSLPPGGLAQARYLCKRIRQQFSTVKIVVGRWGEKENLERIEKRLRDAGADHIGTTLEESRAQIIPLLQAAANALLPSPEKPAEVVASR